MKAKVTGLAILLTGIATAVPADDDIMYQPWRFRVDLGGNIPNSPSLTLYDGPVTAGDSMELSAGFQMDFALGYRIAPWLALEGELGLSVNEIDSVGNWTYPDSTLSQISFMANLVLERPRGRFVPFAGIGAGGVLSAVSFGNDYYYYYSSSDGYATDFVPAAQAFAGLRFQFSERSSLGLKYRFLVTDGQKWDVDWWNGADFKIGVDSVAVHSITLTYSFSF